MPRITTVLGTSLARSQYPLIIPFPSWLKNPAAAAFLRRSYDSDEVVLKNRVVEIRSEPLPSWISIS